MDKLSLVNRLMKTKSSDVMHTSAHARAQNGDNIGAGSTQSFHARRSIEDNRQYIRGYRDSSLGSNFNSATACKQYNAKDDNNSISRRSYNNSRASNFTDGSHSARDTHHANSPFETSSLDYTHNTTVSTKNNNLNKKTSSRINKSSPMSRQGNISSHSAAHIIKPDIHPKF